MQNKFTWYAFKTLLLWLFLAIYTFTQVDLNLTLSTNSAYLGIQHYFTLLGYYQRPLSTVLFLAIVLSLTLLYLKFLRLEDKLLNTKNLFILVVSIYIVGVFAYPAFSYDIFNYIFDARIVTKYSLSPYYFTALDFPDDTWTRFMRWTHRYYPYGPLWLPISLVPSWLGSEKFLLTLLNFKLLFFFCAFINVLLIFKIAQKMKKDYRKAALFFGLNPLVIIESIVSPHNETIMLTFFLFSIFLFLSSRGKIQIFALSLCSMILSAAIKFIPVIYVPFFLFSRLIYQKISLERLILGMLVFYTLALIPVVYLREMYAWYFIPLIAFGALLQHHRFVFLLLIGVTLGTLLRYIPFLWFGHWDPPVVQINQWIPIVTIGIAIVVGLTNTKKRILKSIS